jgi:hypothetical protein
MQPQSLRSLLLAVSVAFAFCAAHGMDRSAIVSRHQIKITEADSLNSLSLGNGRFCMTMDITGLQTFPERYCKGVPLGTQSQWGWHWFPNTEHYSIDQALKPLAFHGRTIPYAVQWSDTTAAGKAANYFRQNPHRIHLAHIGLYLEKSDGSQLRVSDITSIDQTLDMWKGDLVSRFIVEGKRVEVVSIIGQESDDVLGVTIKSELIRNGRLGIRISYPYPTGQFLDEGCLYKQVDTAGLKLVKEKPAVLVIRRRIDDMSYFTRLSSSINLRKTAAIPHGFLVAPKPGAESWNFLLSFSPMDSNASPRGFDALRDSVHRSFHAFWNSGAMIDFGKVKDPRAREIERRMVLSLYLTKINCQGASPPQETGLTYSSWFGKPHLEMAWWHGVHFALWGRPDILEGHMSWYLRNSTVAREIARRQGFKGVRWQKMTDNGGRETASSVGSYLIWQQPHLIYFADLLYRITHDSGVVKKYGPLVEATADFMADFAWHDTSTDRYVLGPGVMPAQERFDPETTINPAFELAYWRWGLKTAQMWREMTGGTRNTKWEDVLRKLSALPVKDSLYLASETAADSYSNPKYMTDHPEVLALYGMLPAVEGLDMAIMRRTFNRIWNSWHWSETWGWDFPLCAMTAARLGIPEKAIEALLMPVTTNTYLKNGHNYQNSTLRIYLPGNGAFLTALAMMASGTLENGKKKQGFPADWDIAFEGFNAMP